MRRQARTAARARILAAALETLESAGYGGATARAIALTGGFNQALIYYHFESIDDLLIAALEDFSERRLERYRIALRDVTELTPLVATMTSLYEEDVQSGQLAAAQEVVAGSASSRELGERVVSLMDPWFAFAEEVVQRLVHGTLFEGVIPPKELAYALVALYFGVETLTRMDGDRGKAKALFESGARLAPLADLILHSDVQFGGSS
jgi:AcrR family transcriptional regulator